MESTRVKKFGVIVSNVDVSADLKTARVYIKPEIRESLDWNKKFRNGQKILFWFDFELGDSTAIVSSLYPEDLDKFSEVIRRNVTGKGFLGE